MSQVFGETTDRRITVSGILKLPTPGACFRLPNGSNRCSGYQTGPENILRARGEEMVLVMHSAGISGLFEKFCLIAEIFTIVIVSDPFLQLTVYIYCCWLGEGPIKVVPGEDRPGVL